MDVAFTGTVLSCEPEICKILKEDYHWRERQSHREAGNYKYVIDVSGLSFVPFISILMISRSTAMDGQVVSRD